MEDSSNPSESDFKLKPCIAEILRTDYCQAGLTMLVDKVVLINMTKTEYNRAYRLYLSDGEKSIQAVLTPSMHPFVYTGEIREGSYVKLDKYKLAFGKRLIGAGQVAYLAISDIHTIGLRRKYAEDWTFETHGLLTELPEEKQPRPGPRISKGLSMNLHGEYAVFKDSAADDSLVGFVSEFDAKNEDQASSEDSEQSTSPINPLNNKRKRKATSTSLGELSPNEVAVPEKRRGGSETSADKATSQKALAPPTKSHPDCLPMSMEFYDKAIRAHQKRCHDPAVHYKPEDTMEDVSSEAADSPKLTNPHPRAPPTNDPTHPPTTSLSQQALLALETNSPLTRILTPLSLTPLSTLTTLRHPRTTITSHLAIISWISTHTIKRPNMALKRDLRLVDPSTPKAVLLSVFVDALTFTPAVGTVALFRNLRAHEWEGGSLNAYAKDCKGLEWFVPNPVRDVGEGVVRRLGEWWVRRLEGDRVLRRERARVEEGVGGLEGGGCLS